MLFLPSLKIDFFKQNLIDLESCIFWIVKIIFIYTNYSRDSFCSAANHMTNWVAIHWNESFYYLVIRCNLYTLFLQMFGHIEGCGSRVLPWARWPPLLHSAVTVFLHNRRYKKLKMQSGQYNVQSEIVRVDKDNFYDRNACSCLHLSFFFSKKNQFWMKAKVAI